MKNFKLKPIHFFVTLGLALLIAANYLLPRTPIKNQSVDSSQLTPMADHIAKAHGFFIDEGNLPVGEEPYLIVNKENQERVVALTSKGEAILDANDQQVLGLNGRRKIKMTVDEYNLFLEKLHGLLQLKGMTRSGEK